MMGIGLTFFELLLLGHLVGDYLLQNNWMAQRKGAHIFPCIVHCLLYTAVVCSFTSFSPWWMAAVFLSHFPVDRWSLADKWLRAGSGRSLAEYLEHGTENVPTSQDNPDLGANYAVLRGGFTVLVYTVADNTIHILLMLGSAQGLARLGILVNR
jgi:hypothetical protein